MESRYFILLNIKTGNGLESFARFEMGNNREEAYSIFRQLKGTEARPDKVLFLEFWDTVDGLPVNLDMITCSLDELAANCKLLTKEIFRMNNLEP